MLNRVLIEAKGRVGAKFSVHVTGPTMEVVSSPEIKKQVITVAEDNGFLRPGLSGEPSVVPLDATGEVIEALTAVKVSGYRAEYLLAQAR